MMPFFEIEKVEVKKPKQIQDCSTCPLDKSTQQVVIEGGAKKILILTEKILSLSDLSWLEKQLNFNQIYYEDCWFTSACQCKCKGEPSNKVINCCRQQWQGVVKELKPEKIFLLGRTALTSFLGDRMNGLGEMDRWVGYAIPDQDYGCWVFPMYDVDYVQGHKNPAVEYVFQDHLVNAIEHNKPFVKHYETINVITDVKEAIKHLENIGMSDSKWLSFDYEGTGLKPYREEQELYSVSFATDRYHATSFPIFDNDAFHVRLKKSLYYPLRKTCHNIPFEQKWTRHVLGFEPEGLAFDSMLAAHVLDNRTHICGLKHQVYIRYGVTDYSSDIKQFLEGTREGEDEKSDNRLNNIHLAPVDKLLYYGGQDSMFGYRLAMDQMQELTEKKLDDVYDFFFEGVLALANVTENGMRINENYYRKKEKELTDKLTDLETKIYTSTEGLKWREYAGKDLEISKDAQTKKLVLDVLKLQINKKTKGGQPSVDKEVLKGLSKKHQIFSDIITWRETFKIRGTYVDGFLRESINGLIHPNQNLHTVVTYRPSTTSPNFANIPKRDKEAQKLVRTGVIPRKGHLLLTVDYDGVEVCSGCFYHKDPVMMEYINTDPGRMHTDEAANIFLLDDSFIKAANSDEPWAKAIRYVGKNGFVFPEFYGDYWLSCARSMWSAIDKLVIANADSLKNHLADNGIKTIKQFEEHVKEEERIFWKEKFKVFDGWKAEAWEKYLSLGYVEYLTGFRCGGVLDRKNVVNYPFQGTAFHLLLWSLIELEYETRTQGWDSQICLQVYDEMMFDVHPDELDELVPLIRETMTEKVRKHWDWINVPLSVEIKISEIDGNWFEMKELK